MSSRKNSKHGKNSRDKKKNDRDNDNNKKGDRYTRQGNGTNNGNEELSAVTFKYPGRFATLTRTILLNESLTITELQRKITLSISQHPPDAKSVFQLYYMDEIFPFINKHAQETINTKKSIEKSWDLQTSHFQKIYMKRSELLRQKWLEMKNGPSNKNDQNGANGGGSGTYTVTNHHHHYHQYNYNNNNNHHNGNGTNNDINNGEIANSTTVIFKYYSVHSSAKTNRHIFITSPTKKELLHKIKLSLSSNPPTAKELFEVYYYDEILPFLKKSGQQSIRGKKDLSKVWQIQTKTFKNLYEERAKILLEEWLKMKKENKKNKTKKSRSSSLSSSSPKSQSQKLNESSSSETIIRKIECSLIRTLLNFLLFVECTTKDNCFMLLINNQNERHSEYNKFQTYLKNLGKNLVSYLHIRLFIDNFDSSNLRLHTGKQIIKLCFVNDFEINKEVPKKEEKEEELILFELRFNKLINGLQDKIDHEHIEANLDDETRILSINIPLYN